MLATRLAALVLVASLVAGCVATSSPRSAGPDTGPPDASTTPAPTATPAAARIAGWEADLAALVPDMARLHPDLTRSTPQSVFDAAVAAAQASVPTASDDQLLDDVLRIVALVSAGGCDAHTGAYVWGTGSFPVHSLPLRLWWFDTGIEIVDALAPEQSLIGDRVMAIDGHPMADVLAAVTPLIPRDNDETVRLLMPRFLLMPEVLDGLGLLGPGPVDLTLSAPDGRTTTAPVAPIPMADYNAWAGPYGLHLPVDPAVPYLARIDDLLWWTALPGSQTLFVQYNRVDQVTADQLAGLQAALAEPGLRRVVLDIRHDYGGDIANLDSLLPLFETPAVDRPGRLFLTTGRNTFSAAGILAARLTAATSAVVVGEPMGSCPSPWDDAGDILLPFSGIDVSVSTRVVVGVSATDPRQTIQPAIAAPLTAADWAAGVDPAMQAILRATP